MYAWEPSFIQRVNEARSKELDIMWQFSAWESFMHFYWCVMPYAVTLTTFSCYVYFSADHHLSASVAFVAVSLIDILRGSMGTVPHIINHFVKVRSSSS